MATSRICSIEGCSKPTRLCGGTICGMHYMRQYTHGDPHVVLKERGKNLRWVQEVAIPFQGDECLLWPFERSRTGYGRIAIDSRKRAAHRVICEMVSGPPPTQKHHAAHSCGNGRIGCVNPKHVRWATPSENAFDKLAHGTMAQGERNGNSKITEQVAREVKMLIGTMTQREISEQLGITRGIVKDIKRGHTWAWL